LLPNSPTQATTNSSLYSPFSNNYVIKYYIKNREVGDIEYRYFEKICIWYRWFLDCTCLLYYDIHTSQW